MSVIGDSHFSTACTGTTTCRVLVRSRSMITIVVGHNVAFHPCISQEKEGIVKGDTIYGVTIHAHEPKIIMSNHPMHGAGSSSGDGKGGVPRSAGGRPVCSINCNRCRKPLATTLFICSCDCVFCEGMYNTPRLYNRLS